jgi:hypothetical protein
MKDSETFPVQVTQSSALNHTNIILTSIRELPVKLSGVWLFKNSMRKWHTISCKQSSLKSSAISTIVISPTHLLTLLSPQSHTKTTLRNPRQPSNFARHLPLLLYSPAFNRSIGLLEISEKLRKAVMEKSKINRNLNVSGFVAILMGFDTVHKVFNYGMRYELRCSPSLSLHQRKESQLEC